MPRVPIPKNVASNFLHFKLKTIAESEPNGTNQGQN